MQLITHLEFGNSLDSSVQLTLAVQWAVWAWQLPEVALYRGKEGRVGKMLSSAAHLSVTQDPEAQQGCEYLSSSSSLLLLCLTAIYHKAMSSINYY